MNASKNFKVLCYTLFDVSPAGIFIEKTGNAYAVSRGLPAWNASVVEAEGSGSRSAQYEVEKEARIQGGARQRCGLNLLKLFKHKSSSANVHSTNRYHSNRTNPCETGRNYNREISSDPLFDTPFGGIQSDYEETYPQSRVWSPTRELERRDEISRKRKLEHRADRAYRHTLRAMIRERELRRNRATLTAEPSFREKNTGNEGEISLAARGHSSAIDLDLDYSTDTASLTIREWNMRKEREISLAARRHSSADDLDFKSSADTAELSFREWNVGKEGEIPLPARRHSSADDMDFEFCTDNSGRGIGSPLYMTS